jgi:NDP-sugar pyrophosphorylase family protein
MTSVVITMAGLGRRFREAGYDCAKFCIEVHGRTLFEWSMTSLRSFIDEGALFTFVTRREDAARAFVEAQCRHLRIELAAVIELEALTDGQATSALLARDVLAGEDGPFLVYNIDTFVHPDALPATAVRGDGWIPCFPGLGDGWSFAKADGSGRIVELREKQRISNHATVGLYWFSSFSLYEQAYSDYYSNQRNLEHGEKYIAPLYNHLITSGKPVYLHEVPLNAVIPLGTPQDVANFSASPAPAV